MTERNGITAVPDSWIRYFRGEKTGLKILVLKRCCFFCLHSYILIYMGLKNNIINEWQRPYAGRIYLLELQEPFERLDFQFIPPELNWERTGTWVNVPITGRNNSRKHLTGGEDKISLQLDFSGILAQDPRYCIQQLSWLQSLTVLDGFAGVARNVKLVWGESDIFRHKIWVVKRVGGKLLNFSSYDGLDPRQALVELELELDPTENTRLSSVRLPQFKTPIRSIRDITDLRNNGNIA